MASTTLEARRNLLATRRALKTHRAELATLLANEPSPFDEDGDTCQHEAWESECDYLREEIATYEGYEIEEVAELAELSGM